jgi:hypothetical protein
LHAAVGDRIDQISGDPMSNDFVWRGGDKGDYNAAANWFDLTTGQAATRAPGADDTAQFSSGTYSITGGATAGTLRILPGAHVTIDGAVQIYSVGMLDVDGGSLTLAGSGTQDPATITQKTVYAVQSVRLQDAGDLSFDNALLDASNTSVGAGSVLDFSRNAVSTHFFAPRAIETSQLARAKLAPGGSLVLGDTYLFVNHLRNGNAGFGNSYDARAGISGSQALLPTDFEQGAQFVVAAASSPAGGGNPAPLTSLDFGTVHVGDTTTKTFYADNGGLLPGITGAAAI